MSKKKTLGWTFESDNPATVQAWKDSAPKPKEEKSMPKKATGQPDVTGGPGTTGFTKRLGRLNKLYANLTPEQRANHPGYRRLLAVIQLEQELNDKARKNALGYAQQEEPAVPMAAPQDPNIPQSTTHDKAEQEEQLGIRRGLNDFIQNLGTGGAK
jgi:hypothetical protein